MNILYFSFVELDIPNACQTHTLGILNGFSRNGCSIDAVVPRPIKVKPKIAGVRFFYLWPWQFSPLGILWVKILGTFYFFLLCLWNHYDAIYVRELEINPFPRWCSRIYKIPYYIEINAADLYTKTATETKEKYILRGERNRAADFKQATGLIVPHFPRSRRIIINYALNKKKVHTILNGTFPPEREKIERSEALTRLGLPVDGFYLGFLGIIWENYDLHGLLKAMRICVEEIPTLRLIMIGSGPNTESFKRQASEMGLLERLTFLGYVQPDELFQVMGTIDIGLINLTKKALRDTGPITTRFATYAVFGVPVIGNDFMMEDYPTELSRGLFLVPPEDPHSLADMILWLRNHPKEKEEKAHILYDFVTKRLTWKHVAADILNIMKHDQKMKQPV